MQEISLRNLPELDETRRNDSLYRLACSLQARGASDSEIEKIIREENNFFAKPVLESEIKTIIKSALKNEKGIPYKTYRDLNTVKEKTSPDDLDWEYVEDYIYTNETCEPIFKKTRFKITNLKTGEISKATPFKDLINKDPNGNPIKSLDYLTPEQKATLYNRKGIKKAREENKPLYITEGEKDANTLIKNGLIATCLKSPGEKINKYHLEQLKNIKTIYILPDKDKPGFHKALNLFNSLNKVIDNVYILNWNDSDISESENINSPKFNNWDITDQVEYKKYSAEELLKFINENSVNFFPDKYLDVIDGRPFDITINEIIQLLTTKGFNWKEIHKPTEKTDISEMKIPPREIAKILMETCYFSLIGKRSETAPIAVFDTEKGIYTTSKRHINMLIQGVEECSTHKQKEIYNQIILILHRHDEYKEPFNDKDYSIFKNGIYNHKTLKLEPFTPRKVFLSRINVNFNPNAKEPYFEDWSFSRWLDEISDGDLDKYKLIWQIFGTVIRPNFNNKTAFFVYDDKSNTGKSTFLRLLMNLVGEENTSALDLAQIEDRFYPATAEGKSLIIGDDNDRRLYLDKSNNFKRIVSGEYINVEKKGQDGYQTKYNTTIVQSMNGIPKFGTIDQGLLKRIVIIKFAKQYTGKNINLNVKDKYIYNEELLEFIAYIAINTKIGQIVQTKENKELLAELELISDPIKAFYNEIVCQELQSDLLPSLFLYKLYIDWCKYTQGIKTKLSQRSFTSRLKEFMEENDCWSYKNARLSKDFNINKDFEIWRDIRQNSIDELSSKVNPNNNLDVFKNKYLDQINKSKQQKCFVKNQ